MHFAALLYDEVTASSDLRNKPAILLVCRLLYRCPCPRTLIMAEMIIK
jgi:hypothetical protein